jgi:hypothetical protein
MTKRAVLIALRLILGLLTLAAIGRQLSVQIQLGYSVLNFSVSLQFCRISFAGVVLIFSALYLVKHHQPSVSDDLIRGASVVGMAIVGLVFTVLLRHEDLGPLLPWVNIVHHYIMPVAVVLDWLYQPPKTELVFKQTLLWQIFPLLYLAYVLIRGSVVGWYPSPSWTPRKWAATAASPCILWGYSSPSSSSAGCWSCRETA